MTDHGSNATNRDNGGPAFPTRGGMVFYVPAESREHVQEQVDQLKQETGGLSMRDYFAAKAMQAVLGVVLTRSTEAAKRDAPHICANAYAIADDMLKARQS